MNDYDRLAIDFVTARDEIFWGGGEQMSHLCLNGRKFPIWTSEPGVGREPGTELTDRMNADGSMAGGDYWTTNYPQPTVLSSLGYAIHVENRSYCEIDLTLTREGSVINVWGSSPTISGAGRRQPRYVPDLVKKMSDSFGRQPLCPNGPSVGRLSALKDGANSFARLEKIIAAGAAVSGLWCEDWVGIRQTSFGRRLFWDWQWNETRYPDLPDRIEKLKEHGHALSGLCEPLSRCRRSAICRSGRVGYLACGRTATNPMHVDFGEFDAGVVDFTNPDALAWFSERIIGRKCSISASTAGWRILANICPVDVRLATMVRSDGGA